MCTKSSATGNLNENCSEHVLHGSYWQIKFRNPAAAEAIRTINSLNWQPTLLPNTYIHIMRTIQKGHEGSENESD